MWTCQKGSTPNIHSGAETAKWQIVSFCWMAGNLHWIMLFMQWKLMRNNTTPTSQEKRLSTLSMQQTIDRTVKSYSLQFEAFASKPMCLWMSLHLSGNSTKEFSAKYFKQAVSWHSPWSVIPSHHWLPCFPPGVTH